MYNFHLLEDSRGYLWSASQTGVTRYDGYAYTYFGLSEGLPEWLSLRFIEDPHNRLWVQTFGGYAVFNGTTFIPYPYNERIRSLAYRDQTWHFQVDRNNSLYLGTTRRGLWKIDDRGNLTEAIPANNTWKGIGIWLPDSLPPVVFGLMDTLDNRLLGEELHLFDSRFNHIKTIPAEFYRNKPDCRPFFVSCKDGTLVLSFGHNLFRINREGITQYIRQPAMINSVWEDTWGNLWVATIDSGIVIYPGGVLSPDNENRYFSGITVNWITQDHEGGIWLSVRKDGVWYLPYPPFTGTYPSDTAQGLVSLRNYPLRPTIPRLPVFLTGINISGRDTGILPRYSLNYDENTLSITYTGISFRPRNIRFRYRLSGFNPEWQSTEQRAVEYRNLPSGNYTFELYAQEDEGTRSVQPVKFSFTIMAPYWESWWFRALSGLILVLLIGFVWWLRHRKRAAKRKLEQRLLQLESTALRAQINPHFIFNVLIAIQDFMAKGDKSASEIYLVRFSRLVRLILEDSREGVVLLSRELETLEYYLELERVRFDHRFSYSIDLGPDIHPQQILLPPMLIQPYVENAIIHGIGTENEKGHISIGFRMEKKDRLCCTVKDNGKGCFGDTSPDRKPNNHRPLGLLLSRERLELLNRSFNELPDVEVKDLRREGSAESGTQVTIHIPIIHKQSSRQL